MKTTKSILLVLFCTFLGHGAHAKDHPWIVNLHAKVKELEDLQSDTAKVVFRKGCSDRKYSIKSKIEADSILAKHKTKYFRSGAKKEKIQLYKTSSKNRILVLHIIRMNGLSTYIKYCETDINVKREIGIIKEEVLIDNKYYQMRTYDRYGILTETENLKVY